MLLAFLDPAAQHSLLPFRRTALLLHLCNVALVVGLLRSLFDNRLVAGLLGLLYGVHPLNADAVPWIAGRKTVLTATFALGSLLLYVAYVRHAERANHRDWKRYGASLLMYVCALLSKPTALPVVGLLLVLDYWPLRRLSRRALLEKVPFVLVAGLSAVVTVVSCRSGRAMIDLRRHLRGYRLSIQVPSTVRGLIFDCDRTLVDSMPFHLEAWEHAITRFGGPYDRELIYSKRG